MCANCEEMIEGKDPADLAVLALAIIGGLVDSYIEDEYCDPTMYKALKLGELIARKLNEQEIADRFALLKIQAGEIITTIIEKNNWDLKTEEWS